MKETAKGRNKMCTKWHKKKEIKSEMKIEGKNVMGRRKREKKKLERRRN